jgi:anaerobic selenocysteine-containing dehydrogenase
VALAIAGVMIDQGWFDPEFVRDWTNGPLLIRDDDGTLLRSETLVAGGGFVGWDERREAPIACAIGKCRYTEYTTSANLNRVSA